MNFNMIEGWCLNQQFFFFFFLTLWRVNSASTNLVVCRWKGKIENTMKVGEVN